MSGISKRVSGSWVSDDYSIMKTATDTITTLPATIYADGNNASVGLKGNMSQTGTPTPDNPIQPKGTGERTENIIEGTILNCTISSNGLLLSDSGGYSCVYAEVEEGETYYLSGRNGPYGFYASKPTIGTSVAMDGTRHFGETATIPNGCSYLVVRTLSDEANAMITKGGTAPASYIPTGIKIPISSANTTTPVYLGEVETTRKIKKLVLTGEENWAINQSGTDNAYFSLPTGTEVKLSTQQICTHFVFGTITSSNTKKGIYMTQNGIVRVRENEPSASDLTSFESFLQQQYAAGTPVTVWYVLATEETGIVNEPLMKIGNYADEVSGITIPTIAGADSFDVLTTLKPSEASVNYHGWHPVQSVHEYDSNYTIATMQALTISQLQTHTISELQGGEWL